MRINTYLVELKNSMHKKFADYEHKLAILSQRIDSKSPTKRLSGGYAFVSGKDDKNIKSVEQLEISQEVNLYFMDGRASARIIDVEQNGEYYGKEKERRNWI